MSESGSNRVDPVDEKIREIQKQMREFEDNVEKEELAEKFAELTGTDPKEINVEIDITVKRGNATTPGAGHTLAMASQKVLKQAAQEGVSPEEMAKLWIDMAEIDAPEVGDPKKKDLDDPEEPGYDYIDNDID